MTRQPDQRPAGQPCPNADCRLRFLTERALLDHLALAHDETGERWRTDPEVMPDA